ncbi:anucleate primary sterigmata protein B [Purpureocillium lavendulum]|uniref:Anucleate primary sterigmata protein B n=1 Tax=Purpureocillium lavendulum TaxID=1247861 RepID=A0AB34FQB8_9HYPO|nr:anucleate primary sterigmata protein B [Purpureocillium lavendulum]
MADDETHSGHQPSIDPQSRPSTAMRMPEESATASSEPQQHGADAHADAPNATTTTASNPDDSLLNLLPPSAAAGSRSQSAASRSPTRAESSYMETTAIDQTRPPDETMTEEAVRRHLQDVESSFLPTLSPIATGSTNGGEGGIDDSYLFDSPDKAAAQPRRPRDEADTTAVSSTTENLENLDSSPTAAAAARTISRAVSMATNPQGSTVAEDDSITSDRENPFLSADDAASASLSRSQSLSERIDAGSTPGNSLRVSKRPKYLRSRFGSQRSSTSSFVTNPESHDGSDATVGHGLDFALQSGGAVPASGMPRGPSVGLPRTISFGSVASGIGADDYDTPGHQLEPLAEIDSPPQKRHTDLMSTPKPSKEHLNSAPTDTVIAQHVRNVHVPESLAKEYRFKNGLQTPRRPSTLTASTGTVGRSGKNLTLKEQSSTIERLSKENFDLKLKVMFLSDRLDKLSEEGIKEMISENVSLKTNYAVLQRDNKMLRKKVKELERQAKEEENRPSTARSGTDSTDHTPRLDDEEAQEREVELLYLRERVEEYASEIERLRNEGVHRENEKRKLAEFVKTMGDRTGENLGRQEEADVWKDLLEQETARREQADDDNAKLRDEVFRLKRELSAGQGTMHHTTNIYNITKKHKDPNASPSRPVSGLSGDVEESNANFSAATTLVEELRRESEQLRHENAELRREVGAQTSMLVSRNREKDRLYSEIEELKMAQRRVGGGVAPSTVDSILERSASRAGHERSNSRGSAKTRQTFAEDEAEREELENKLAEVRDKLSEAKLQNQELQRELEACMQDFETAVEDKRQVEETALTLQEDLDNAMNDLVAIQAERDEALREQGDMETEFEALRREAQDEIDALESEADQRNEDIQRLQADLRDRTENFDALQEEMRKMSEALIGLEDDQDDKMRRIRQVEEELESSNKELEELEQKLIEANDKNQRLSVQQESSQGEIAFLREEQEADKIRIGDLEAALANAEQSLRDEKDRAKELDGRLQQERVQREMVANREKEEVQQFVNELNREASDAKDEVRRLRKSLSSREVEATEWKERLIELENNLREALGDLNGTRSSLLKVRFRPFFHKLRGTNTEKSIAKMQRELENTIRELDSTKASVNEKDRIIKQRDALLESHALESRKVAELLDKERIAHRNTKSQYDTFQKTHSHLSQTASTQDVRIAELESTRGQDRRRLAQLEQTAREQLQERNELLLTLWQRLSSFCGREWLNNNALVDRQVVPSVEVIASRLPGFSKNLLSAIKAIEGMFGSLQTKIKSVERDLTREYQALENNLEVRVKKLDRLETMVRNSIASGSLGPQDAHTRMQRLEDAYRQLKVENATLRTAHDVRSRASHSNTDGTVAYAGGGSPSPAVPRGPGDRDRSRSSRQERSSRSAGSGRSGATSGIPRPATSGAYGAMDVALTGDAEAAGGASNNDNRWLFRLRDMEYKLKMEREGRNQDRQAARQRLGGLELENRDLRERVRRTNSEAD